jgi:thiol-disulfide isomerase/thioredoxin
MLHCRLLTVCLLLLAVRSALSAEAVTPSSSALPRTVFEKAEKLLAFPAGRPTSQAEYREQIAKYVRQLDELLEYGRSVEQKHPRAANLHRLRVKMLEAAHFLTRFRKTNRALAELLAVAKRLAASDAPPDSKVYAEYFVVREAIAPAGQPPAKDAEKRIRDYVRRYAEAKAAKTRAISLVRAVELARKASRPKLEKELLDALEAGYARDLVVHLLLRRAGRKPPFYADLKLLNGKSLSLPEDLKGKVLVVDFWATWCAPCVVALPHMKKLYAEYKPKGVEFLGISLDRPGQRDKVVAFIEKRQLDWLHVYTGDPKGDPTARFYGVSTIPRVWVIGRDGRIFSDKARGDLAGVLDRALAPSAPPAKPPGKG